MINLTSQYPNQTFLPFASTQLANQWNTINSTRIINKDFPKKYRRSNTGLATDGSGSATSQIDAAFGALPYGFPNLQTIQSYCLQAANQMVNNASYYIENIQPTYYQLIVWGSPQ